MEWNGNGMKSSGREENRTDRNKNVLELWYDGVIWAPVD